MASPTNCSGVIRSFITIAARMTLLNALVFLGGAVQPVLFQYCLILENRRRNMAIDSRQ
jgi:hypothetical protein